ncbi:hypothetical protein PRBRB14_08210 [Hallella multisaccharivorax DSM 17128]|uniref:Lipoprotein n=1 Tax=Hallella multisaccharivorax DSM 17128 TaxID=688246 RepID=F8N7R3_9BACT|nr:DUF1573 domain-containing protein [Hallella multisaccharivorax]EGN56418.1 protein of unknown function DUF1573 [Hallella multisaccharivorax DSM 17128]GJG29942.1 hypothetical protein PRBRB14_08210 [Hallella multisaccharivorax DSM 17128]
MERVFFVLLSLMLLTGCRKENKMAVTASKAKIDFETVEYNFNNVGQGHPQEYDFVFHNVGATPLVIQKTETGCSCTQVDYDKEPVDAGEGGIIRVTYLANNGTGRFSHFIAVYSNGADSTGYTTLHIEGEVSARH